MTYSWGLLGPEFLSSTRRTRSLGINAAVRDFNERAVPGLGGARFAKQIFLAVLGVHVAELARESGTTVKNIEVTNAIEALACYLAFNNNGWQSDSRLRGITKLSNKAPKFSFTTAKQRLFYVTQPMRMACVQTLSALGLVEAEGTQFNAYRCSTLGEKFIAHACGEIPSVVKHLRQWVCTPDLSFNPKKLHNALSPLQPLSAEAKSLLRECLIQDHNDQTELRGRRSAALAWVERLRTTQTMPTDLAKKPDEIADDHWQDLRSGAQFFKVRDTAIALLDQLENYLGQHSKRTLCLKEELPEAFAAAIETLQKEAQAFLQTAGAKEESASAFCNDCAQLDAKKIIQSLVERDGVVLRLSAGTIRPGPAFIGLNHDRNDQDTTDSIDDSVALAIPLPLGISHRVRNLFLLNADLQGDVEKWINKDPNGVEA